MIRTTLLLTLAVAAGVGALRFADAVANADINIVRVEGELTEAERSQVRGAVTVALHGTSMGTAADIVEAIQELGWVRLVRVRRHWPDILHVAVIRETLAARWGDDAWLTAGGNVVPAPSNHELVGAARLPAIRTHLSDGPQAMQVFDLINGAAQSLGLDIDRLEEDAAGHWTVSFAGGPEVMLGASDFMQRFQRFAVVHRALLRHETRPVAHVDARYRTGVAVRWEQPPGTAAPIEARTLAGAAAGPAPPPAGLAEPNASGPHSADARFASIAPRSGR